MEERGTDGKGQERSLALSAQYSRILSNRYHCLSELKPTGLQTVGGTVDDGVHVVCLTRLTCCSGVSEYSRTTTSTSPEDGEEIWKL